VEEPLCGFRIVYQNDSCVNNSAVELTVEYEPEHAVDDKLKRMFKNGVCYYDSSALTCICYGHRCNDAPHMKEILAMELARGALSSAKNVITCFLFRDEASAVFGTQPTTRSTSTEAATEAPETVGPAETEASEEITMLITTTTSKPLLYAAPDQDNHANKKEAVQGEKEDLYLIIFLAVGVIALLLICLSIIFIIMSIVNIAQRNKVLKSMKDGSPSSRWQPSSSGMSGEVNEPPFSSNREQPSNGRRSALPSNSARKNAPDLYANYESNLWDSN
ncbi:hypothetical protein GCK32_012835, partial [Trichostrongylus colubriformis]